MRRFIYYSILTVLFLVLWTIIVILPAVFLSDPKDRDNSPSVFACLIAVSIFVGLKAYIKKKWFKDL